MYESAKVLFDMLDADLKWNLRTDASYKGDDNKSIQILAEDIGKNGQLSDLIVKRGVKPGRYDVICGFRRYLAFKHLRDEGEKKDAPSYCKGWNKPIGVKVLELADFKGNVASLLQEAMILNMVENVNRESLTPYETAVGTHRLQLSGLSAGKIAHRLAGGAQEGGGRLSESYIRNLNGIMSTVHKKILEAWKDGHKKATVANLHSLASVKDMGEQLEKWSAMCGQPVEGQKAPKLDAEGNPVPATPKREFPVPGPRTLEKAREVIKASKMGESEKEGMLMILGWCLGEHEAIKSKGAVVYSPKEEKAAEAAAREAKKAADKAKKEEEKAAAKAAKEDAAEED